MKFTSQNNVITVKHVYETCYRVYMKKGTIHEKEYICHCIHA